MLLWFLKDQRVYLHNVIFLAYFNWEFFQGIKIHDTIVIKPMYKLAFVIFRHLATHVASHYLNGVSRGMER